MRQRDGGNLPSSRSNRKKEGAEGAGLRQVLILRSLVSLSLQLHHVTRHPRRVLLHEGQRSYNWARN